MTPEQAKQFLPLFQAVADGKTLQSLQGDEWKDVVSSITYKSAERYRIKPEPMEFDVWVTVIGSKVYAIDNDMGNYEKEGWRKIRVREITE